MYLVVSISHLQSDFCLLATKFDAMSHSTLTNRPYFTQIEWLEMLHNYT
jgi:hypothetical protein